MADFSNAELRIEEEITVNSRPKYRRYSAVVRIPTDPTQHPRNVNHPQLRSHPPSDRLTCSHPPHIGDHCPICHVPHRHWFHVDLRQREEYLDQRLRGLDRLELEKREREISEREHRLRAQQQELDRQRKVDQQSARVENPMSFSDQYLPPMNQAQDLRDREEDMIERAKRMSMADQRKTPTPRPSRRSMPYAFAGRFPPDGRGSRTNDELSAEEESLVEQAKLESMTTLRVATSANDQTRSNDRTTVFSTNQPLPTRRVSPPPPYRPASLGDTHTWSDLPGVNDDDMFTNANTHVDRLLPAATNPNFMRLLKDYNSFMLAVDLGAYRGKYRHLLP